MYQINFKEPIHVHFMGIGGISMSGLAQILLDEGFTVPGAKEKKAYLIEKGYPGDKLSEVIGQAQQARANGEQVLVVRMNKNKKFQKEQLKKEGYEDFVEFFNRD